MRSSEEFYESLKTVHKIKKKEIRIYKRKSLLEEEETLKSMKFNFGSIWGIEDKLVPFDYKRNETNYKDSLRPSLIIETPLKFGDNQLVKLAPGTTKFHKCKKIRDFCLFVSVPPEELDQSTYFLIYFSWKAVQKNLQKRFCELSTKAKERLSILVKEFDNE